MRALIRKRPLDSRTAYVFSVARTNRSNAPLPPTHHLSGGTRDRPLDDPALEARRPGVGRRHDGRVVLARTHGCCCSPTHQTASDYDDPAGVKTHLAAERRLAARGMW